MNSDLTTNTPYFDLPLQLRLLTDIGSIEANPSIESKSLLILFHFLHFIPLEFILNDNITYSLFRDFSKGV